MLDSVTHVYQGMMIYSPVIHSKARPRQQNTAKVMCAILRLRSWGATLCSSHQTHIFKNKDLCVHTLKTAKPEKIAHHCSVK